MFSHYLLTPDFLSQNLMDGYNYVCMYEIDEQFTKFYAEILIEKTI